MEPTGAQGDELRTLSMLLAHDLRNLLSVMSNLVILLEHRPDPRYVRMLKSQMDLCEEAVEHYMRYLHEGLVRGPVRLAQLVGQVAGMDAFPENIRLVVQPEYEGEVIADPQQVRQVLLNLLMNAVSACGEGSGTIRIGISRESDFARVDVEDNGPGLPANIREELLARRVSSATERGMGLGLHLCRRILESGGGRMSFESTPGTGARFSFWLPISESMPS